MICQGAFYLKKRVYLFSDFPNSNKPTFFVFIKHRVEVLKKKYDITVISVNIGNNFNKSHECIQYDGYKHLLINVKTSSVPRLRFFIYQHNIIKFLRIYLKEERPDLIDVHFSSNYSWIIRDLCIKYSIPFIITEHASFFERKIEKPYIGRKIKKAIGNADKVLAVSRFLKNTMQNYIEREIEIVPNIVDTNKFKPLKSKPNNKIPKIITVGGLDKDDKKGYELLINTLSKLSKDGYVFNCNIIGDGPNYNKLKAQIDQLDLSENVFLLGSIPNHELVNYYNESDFFVSSSKKETFGVAITEAMSCGLPVVSIKSGGPEEFITSEVGLLADHNIDALVINMKVMLENYKQYNKYLIRKKVDDNYSEQKYLEKMSVIYDEILNN